MKIDEREVYEVIEKIRSNNPYPMDIFVGLTEDGLRAKAGRIAWNNCCEKLLEELRNAIHSKANSA